MADTDQHEPDEFTRLTGEALAAVVGNHWTAHKEAAKRLMRAFWGPSYPHPQVSALELVIAHAIAKAAVAERERSVRLVREHCPGDTIGERCTMQDLVDMIEGRRCETCGRASEWCPGHPAS